MRVQKALRDLSIPKHYRRFSKPAKLIIWSLCHLALASCQTKQKTMERFDWSQTLTAPKGYPCIIIKGGLSSSIPNEQGAGFGLWAGGTTNAGWGRVGGVVTSSLKAIPDSLQITWYSVLEEKFYTGSFQLPSDKIKELFKTGFFDHELNRQETFGKIIVGMAPGGIVAVWLLSGQVEVEVGRFQATEIQLKPEDVHGDAKVVFRKTYIQAIYEEDVIAQGPIPFGLWDSYRIKHSWRHKMDFPHNFKNTESYLSMYNGEKEHLYVQEPSHQDFKKRALPQDMRLLWTDDKGGLWGAEVYFDEAELFKAFGEILKKDPEQNIEIVFTPDATNTAFTVMLQSKTEEIDLPKTKVKPYARTR